MGHLIGDIVFWYWLYGLLKSRERYNLYKEWNVWLFLIITKSTQDKVNWYKSTWQSGCGFVLEGARSSFLSLVILAYTLSLFLKHLHTQWWPFLQYWWLHYDNIFQVVQTRLQNYSASKQTYSTTLFGLMVPVASLILGGDVRWVVHAGCDVTSRMCWRGGGRRRMNLSTAWPTHFKRADEMP